MSTGIDNMSDDTPAQPPITTRQLSSISRSRSSIMSVLILIGLAIVALIPRLILALQLDIVTDEVVYLFAGKVYLPLLTHFNFSFDSWMTVLHNYEHPPLFKLMAGTSMELNSKLGHPMGELLAGRLPSVIMGTVLVLAVYWLGRAPFGRTVALFGALALALSPWLSYFSAIAYLDMTMASLVTISYLFLWHATRRPRLFAIVGLFIGLAAATKYPATFVIPTIVLFTAYYYFLLRPMMPKEQQPALPWRWWGAAVIVAPLAFYVADPAIWPSPVSRLLYSFSFEENGNLSQGHQTFLAGQILQYVPKWTILYMTFVKMSAFLTIPAVFFVIFAIVQLVRFHLRKTPLTNPSAETAGYVQAARYAYLVIWLLGVMGAFSLLNIAVGTHYYLPLAPSVAVAGVAGLAIILRYLAGLVWKKADHVATEQEEVATRDAVGVKRFGPRLVVPLVVLAVLIIVPPLLGLITVHGAEGYTTEFFNDNENASLQVAYPDYRDALNWLATDTDTHTTSVGLIGTALNGYSSSTNWFSYNQNLVQEYRVLKQVDNSKATVQTYQQFDYLVWPKDVLQRGGMWPAQYHVVHTISGGNTIYCYILQVTH